jgi:sulfite exporter TauE/SafE
MNKITQLYLAGRIAALLIWAGGILSTYGVSITSTDNYQGISMTIAGVIITLLGQGIAEAKQYYLLWTAPKGTKIVSVLSPSPTVTPTTNK